MSAYGNMEKGLPGLLVGLPHTHAIDSRAALGEIPFGGLCFGTGDGEQVKPTGDSALLGVAVRDGKAGETYKTGEVVGVNRTGKILVLAGEALTADAEVSVNGSTGKVISKASDAAGAKRTLTITVANASAESKVASVIVGDKVAQVTTTASVKAAADVAAALKTALEGLDIPFVATVSSAVITLTAKEKGAGMNGVAVIASTTDGTQTLTVAAGTSGSDAILNPGWHVRTPAEAAGDLVELDLD